MRLDLFLDYYEKRGFSDDAIEAGVRALTRAEGMLMRQGTALDKANQAQVRILLDQWIEDQHNDPDAILALARYFYLTQRNDLYVYFASLTGGMGVIETIKERFNEIMDPLTATSVLDVPQPPLGSDPSKVPDFTQKFMTQLEKVATSDQTHQILCGNNHGLSKAAFAKEKEIYEASPSMEAYLKGLHQRKVQELQDHCDQNKVWFEQKITQEAVDFVASNQELLSAVHQNGILYLTKIPYDPSNYLKETDPLKRCYLACHCPFVREAILKGKPVVSSAWCSCSAGFEKFHFESILDRTLDVQVLQSVLKGDPICRFAIKL